MEVTHKLVMEAHGQQTKQEFKALELVPGWDGGFMFDTEGCDETLEHGCASCAEIPGENARDCIQGFKNMFGTSPFPPRDLEDLR